MNYRFFVFFVPEKVALLRYHPAPQLLSGAIGQSKNVVREVILLPTPHDGCHLLLAFSRSHRHRRLRAVPKHIVIVAEVGLFHLRGNVRPPFVRELGRTHLQGTN